MLWTDGNEEGVLWVRELVEGGGGRVGGGVGSE
jgi:hypothetical protein